MKTINAYLTIAILSVISLSHASKVESQGDLGGQDNLGKLIAAIIAVESGGRQYIVGDNGKSHGPMQIQQGVVLDVNRLLGSPKYTFPNDCYDFQKSSEMFQIYVTHYGRRERLGRNPTWQDYARIWNGGPNGYRKEVTVKYWRKVEKVLN
jgi:hypothetical protein